MHGLLTSTIHQNCVNHDITIMLTKSNFGKIVGGYSPMKWENYSFKVITGGESFIFFYDDDLMRKCT